MTDTPEVPATQQQMLAPFMVIWSGVKPDRSTEDDVEYVRASGALDASGQVLDALKQRGFCGAKIVASVQIVHTPEWTTDEIDDAVQNHEREVAYLAEVAEEQRIEQEQIAAAEAEAAAAAAAETKTTARKRTKGA